MARYRAGLPQVGGGVFLTDSGIETVLIFHHGYELPDFAAFVLLDDEAGVETLRSYYRDHAAIARDAGAGFIFESPTWRASPDWAKRLGYTDGALAAANRKAIDMLVEIRSELDGDGPPMVVSGCVGPRGDGYQPSALMTAEEAQSYHSTQIANVRGDRGRHGDGDHDHLCGRGARDRPGGAGRRNARRHLVHGRDRWRPAGRQLVGARNLRGRRRHGGRSRLLHGQLRAPTHFDHVLESGGQWRERIRGIRANASRMSHAELDEAQELDDGDPHELSQQYAQLQASLPTITVLGGCCGTDLRHVQQIATACVRR